MNTSGLKLSNSLDFYPLATQNDLLKENKRQKNSLKENKRELISKKIEGMEQIIRGEDEEGVVKRGSLKDGKPISKSCPVLPKMNEISQMLLETHKENKEASVLLLLLRNPTLSETELNEGVNQLITIILTENKFKQTAEFIKTINSKNLSRIISLLVKKMPLEGQVALSKEFPVLTLYNSKIPTEKFNNGLDELISLVSERANGARLIENLPDVYLNEIMSQLTQKLNVKKQSELIIALLSKEIEESEETVLENLFLRGRSPGLLLLTEFNIKMLKQASLDKFVIKQLKQTNTIIESGITDHRSSAKQKQAFVEICVNFMDKLLIKFNKKSPPLLKETYTELKKSIRLKFPDKTNFFLVNLLVIRGLSPLIANDFKRGEEYTLQMVSNGLVLSSVLRRLANNQKFEKNDNDSMNIFFKSKKAADQRDMIIQAITT